MDLHEPAQIFYDTSIDHYERRRLLEVAMERVADEDARLNLQQYLGDTQRMIDQGFDRWRTDASPAASRDEVMRRAVNDAAHDVRRDPSRTSFLESLLEGALVDAWNFNATGGQAKPRVQLQVPGWDPRPGATDLVLTLLGDRQPTAVAELKVLDVDQTLWDLVKLLSLLDGDEDLVRGYLVVATTPRRWRHAEVAALYAPPDAMAPDGVREWSTAALLERWAASWRNLLAGGRARPRDVPGSLRTTFLASYPVAAFPEYELRAIAVEPLAGRRRLQLGEDGWPPATQPTGKRFGLSELVRAHLDAHRFRNAHPDLRSHHERRRAALAGALGIDLDRPLRDRDPLAELLAETLARIAQSSSPFDGYLEAPQSVAAMHRRHSTRIDEARRVLSERLIDLAADIITVLWQVDRDVMVTTQDLVELGFDPSHPAPDPLDYL